MGIVYPIVILHMYMYIYIHTMGYDADVIENTMGGTYIYICIYTYI